MRPKVTRSTSNSLCQCVQQVDSATQQNHVDRYAHHLPKHRQRKLIERITCSRGVATEAKHRHRRNHKLINWSANNQQTTKKQNGSKSQVIIETFSIHSYIGGALSNSSSSTISSDTDKNIDIEPKLLPIRASVPLFVSSEAKITERVEYSPANDKSIQFNTVKEKANNKGKAFGKTQSLSNNLVNLIRDTTFKLKNARSPSRSGLLNQAETEIDTRIRKEITDHKCKDEKKTDRIVRLSSDIRKGVKTSRVRLRKSAVTISPVVVTQRHRSSGTDEKLFGSIGDITTWATAVITDILYKPETRKSTTVTENNHNKQLSSKLGIKIAQKNAKSKRSRLSKKVSSGMIVRQRILSQCKGKKKLDDIKLRKANQNEKLKREKPIQKLRDISNLSIGSCKKHSDTSKIKDSPKETRPIFESNHTKLVDGSNVVVSKERNNTEQTLTSPKKGGNRTVHNNLISSTKCNASYTSIDRCKEIVYRPVVKKCFSALKSGNSNEIKKHKDSFVKNIAKPLKSRHNIDGKGDIVTNNKIYGPGTEKKRKEEEKEKRKSRAHITSAENKTYTIEPKVPDDRARHRTQKQAAELRAAINVKAVNPYPSVKKIQRDNSQLEETRATRKVKNPFIKVVDPDDPPHSTLKIESSFEKELFKQKQNISSSSSNNKLSGNEKVNNRKKYRRRRQKRSPFLTKPQGQTGATIRDQIYYTLDFTLGNNKWSPNKLYNSEPFENKEVSENKSKKCHKRDRIGNDFIAREIVSSISCPVNDKTDKQHFNQKSSNNKIPAKTNNIVAKLKRCFCAFKFPNKIKEKNLLQPHISPSGKEFQNGSSFSINLGLYRDTSSPEAIHTPIISGNAIKTPSEVVMDVINGSDDCNENAKLEYTMKPSATDENMRRCYRWLNLHSRKFVNPSVTAMCKKDLSNSRRVNSAITSEHTFIPCDFNQGKFEQMLNERNRIKKHQKFVHTMNPFEANFTNVQPKRKHKVKSQVTETGPNDGDYLSQRRPSLERIRPMSKQSKTRGNNVMSDDVTHAPPSIFLRGSKFSFDVEICQEGTALIRYSKPKPYQNNSKIKECYCDYPKECQAFCEFHSSSQSTSVHDKNSLDPIRYRNFLKQVLRPTKKSNPQTTRKLKNIATKQKKANQNMLNRNISDHNQSFHHHKLRKQSPNKYKCACLVTPEESNLSKRLSQHLIQSDLNIMHNLERNYEGYPNPQYLIHKVRKPRFNSNATSKIDQSYRKRVDPHQNESETNINVQHSVSSILKKCLSTLKFQKSKKDAILTQGHSEEASCDSSKRMQALQISGVNVVPGKCTYLEYPVLLDKKYTDISRSISDEHRKRKKSGHRLNNYKLKDVRTQHENNSMPTIPHPIRSNFSLEVENKLRSPSKLAPLLPKFCEKPQENYRGIHLSENIRKIDVPPVYRHNPVEHAGKKYNYVTVDSKKHIKRGTLDRVSECNEMLVRYESNKKCTECLSKKQLRSKQISRTGFNFEYFFELSPTYNIPRRYDKAVARSLRGKKSSTIVNPSFANPATQPPGKTRHFYGPDGKLLQGKSSVIVAAMWKVIRDDNITIQRTKLHKKGVPCKCKKGAPCRIVNKTTCQDKGSKEGTGKGGGDKADKGKSGKKCACGGRGGKKGGNGDDKGSKVTKSGICGKHAKSEKGGKGKCQGKGKCPSAMAKQEEDDGKISREDFPDVPNWAFSVLEFLKLLPDKKKRETPKAYKVKCPGKKKCMKKEGDEEEDEEEEEDDDEEKLRKKILETLYITKDKMKFKFDSDICHKVQGKKKPPFFNPPGKVQKSVCEWPGCKDEIEKLKRPCTVCGFNDEAALHIKVDKHGMGIVNKEDLRKKIVEREVTAGKKKVKCSEFLKDTRPGDRPTCLCCPTPVCTKHDADKSKKPPCGMQLTLDPKYSLKMPCSPFRPCVCGSGVCKKEHAAMIHAMARPKFIPCVCGSPVCEEERKHVAERKHAKEAMKLKKKLMKMKAEHRDFALKNLDMFYLNSYLHGDLELKLFQDTMRGLPLSAQERDTLVKRDKERELRKDKNCQYRMRRYAEIEEEIARLRRKDDKKATFLMGDPYKLGTIPAITGSITDLGRAGARGLSNIARKSFRTIVDPSCPPGKLPLKERFMIKLKKDYCYGHIKTPLQRAQARFCTFGCVRYLLECVYEHPTLYEFLTSCTEKGQELRRKRARLRQEVRDTKCTVATDVMQNPPCPACYSRFPALYPRLLTIVSIYRQCKDMMCFLLAVLVWTPCLLFAEAVRAAICCSLCL